MTALRERDALLRLAVERTSTRYVVGHFAYNPAIHDAQGDRFAWITILRRPIDRWLSEYWYNRMKAARHLRHDMGLERYLESPIGVAAGSRMVRLLAGRPWEPRPMDQRIEEAKANLDRFTVVGRVEAMDQFQKAFHDRFGVELQVPRRNLAPRPDDRPALDSDVYGRVRGLCGPDEVLYDHVLSSRSAAPRPQRYD